MESRLEKLEKIKQLGIEPYGGKFRRNYSIKQLIENYEELVSPIMEGKKEKASVGGRIMALRGHGKTAFLDIQDESGRMQIYIKKDNVIAKDFLLFKELDIGDIIGLEGILFVTQKGEKTIKADRLFLLSKSLRPLPEKWHGLKDIEIRYRRRCLDLIVNPATKETFLTRAEIIRQIRIFMEKREFIEVETPMLQNLAGGAKAKPFITHYNALNCDVYLRIAPEIYLKRLLVGGLEKIYELSRNFRNEGISAVHNPEFTMLELYEAYADYTDMMRLTEELIINLTNTLAPLRAQAGTGTGNILKGSKIKWGDKEIDLKLPWAKIPFYDVLKRETGIDFQDKNLDFKEVAVKLEMDSADLNNVFGKFVEPKLIHPTFVIDYPAFLCPLAKRKKDNPQLSERFELFIGGQELANAYSELNDPLEQRKRFEKQALHQSGAGQGGEIDEDFLAALEQGMPPAGGLGIGVDRLIMLLTNKSSIREVLLFPQLKPVRNS